MMLIINLILAACCLLSAFGGVFSPDYFHAIPAIALLTFPVWVVVMPLLLVFDLILSKRSAWVPILTMIFCVGPFLDFCPVTLFNKSTKDSTTFSIMTYNTYGMMNYAEAAVPGSLTAAAIIDADCDIVCLQELTGNITAYPEVAAGQSDSIKKIFPYRIHSSLGLPSLSRYKIKSVFSTEFDDSSAQLEKYIVNLDSIDLTIYNVHLQSIGLNSDDKETYMQLTKGHARGNIEKIKSGILSKLNHAFKQRAKQARLIREYLDNDSAQNIIVCGDFNDVSSCYAARTIMGKDFKNAYTEAGCGPTATYRANRLYFHIDQILYKGNLKPVSIKTLKWGNSDHFPVKAIFKFENQ